MWSFPFWPNLTAKSCDHCSQPIRWLDSLKSPTSRRNLRDFVRFHPNFFSHLKSKAVKTALLKIRPLLNSAFTKAPTCCSQVKTAVTERDIYKLTCIKLVQKAHICFLISASIGAREHEGTFYFLYSLKESFVKDSQK